MRSSLLIDMAWLHRVQSKWCVPYVDAQGLTHDDTLLALKCMTRLNSCSKLYCQHKVCVLTSALTKDGSSCSVAF